MNILSQMKPTWLIVIYFVVLFAAGFGFGIYLESQALFGLVLGSVSSVLLLLIGYVLFLDRF